MEQYLNENDSMKLEIEQLELLLGPGDSEVNVRFFLRNASRRSGMYIWNLHFDRKE